MFEIGNEYGSLQVKEIDGKYYWTVDGCDGCGGDDWHEIQKSLYDELIKHRDGINYSSAFTGEVDKCWKKIYYETSVLKFPDGTLGKLMFDKGQMSAYYARINNACITEFEGVNNVNSIYLRDCEVVN